MKRFFFFKCCTAPESKFSGDTRHDCSIHLCEQYIHTPMHESVLFVGGGVPRANIPSVWALRDPPPLALPSLPPMTTQISAGLTSPTFPLLVSDVPGSFFTVTGGELLLLVGEARVGEGPSTVALPPSTCSFPRLGASCTLMTPPPLTPCFCVRRIHKGQADRDIVCHTAMYCFNKGNISAQ